MRLSVPLLALGCAILFAIHLPAESLSQQIDPPEVGVGDEVTVTYTIQSGSLDKVALPPVEGLQADPNPTLTTSIAFSYGTLSRSMSETFRVTPTHSGDFTIPAFEITASDGSKFHSKPLKLHVVEAGVVPQNNPQPSAPAPSTNPDAVRNGPVIMPPNNPGSALGAIDITNQVDDPYASVPKDADGGPAKVFMLITPDTTDAYVGQSVPIQIDFYIRMESNADQNSLPTIKGSDFLMNNFSVRGQQTLTMVENVQYERDIWRSAISAPKSGDFPLAMERDTYWVKSTAGSNVDPFAGFFNRHQNLAHQMIASNQLTIHVRPLPDEGRPEHFSGAIGEFKVIGDAAPSIVAMGDPVKLHFTVTGVGNFDYVRCPFLPDDSAWKTYVPTSKTNYLERDESRTHASKEFMQSVVALKNGNVPLQVATFSYFDLLQKRYVTTPIPFPSITVTGSPLPVSESAPATTGDATTTAAATPKPFEFVPNRLEMGSTFASLTPIYRKAWFWYVQGGLFGLACLGALFFVFRPRTIEDKSRAERTRLHSSQLQEEQVMADAIQRNDPLAFFTAARHAVQLQLGSQWHVPPEALTLGEIRSRDPQRAETLEPLFLQANEVIYSGRMDSQIDLAHWQQTVRELLQQPQVASK
jgi:BatD DUF11 like domain